MRNNQNQRQEQQNSYGKSFLNVYNFIPFGKDVNRSSNAERERADRCNSLHIDTQN